MDCHGLPALDNIWARSLTGSQTLHLYRQIWTIPMKTRKDSSSKPVPNSSACNIEIPAYGAVHRLHRKFTMATLIRILLGLVVFLTFLGNILFILETRRMNAEGEKSIIEHESSRQSLYRSREGADSDVVKTTTASSEYVLFCCGTHRAIPCR